MYIKTVRRAPKIREAGAIMAGKTAEAVQKGIRKIIQLRLKHRLRLIEVQK